MFDHKFFGAATVGEKGQIVIPVEARNALNLKVGDKLLVISGPKKHGLLLINADMLKEMTKKMSESYEKLEAFANQE